MSDELERDYPKLFAAYERNMAERRAAGLTCAFYRGAEQIMIEPDTDDLFVRVSFVFQDGTGFHIDIHEPIPLLKYARELRAAGLSETIQHH